MPQPETSKPLRERHFIDGFQFQLILIATFVVSAIYLCFHWCTENPGLGFSLHPIFEKIILFSHMVKLGYVSDPKVLSDNFLFDFARLGVGISVIFGAFNLLWPYFRNYYWHFWVRWFVRDHVVILGTGEKGYVLASSLLQNRSLKVVAIDGKKDNPFVENLRRSGAYVFRCDMEDVTTVRTLGLNRAKRVYVTSGDDSLNIAVASRIQEYLVPIPEANKPVVQIQIHDPTLRRLFTTYSSEETNHHIPFSVYHEAARYLFETYSPDLVDDWCADQPYHIVIVGCGWLGESLIRQAIRMGIFLKRNGDGKRAFPDEGTADVFAPPLMITVIDVDKNLHEKRLFAQSPILQRSVVETEQPNSEGRFGGCGPFVDVEFIGEDILSISELPLRIRKNPVTRVFVCLNDEAIAIEAAEHIARLLSRQGNGDAKTILALPGESQAANCLRGSFSKNIVEVNTIRKAFHLESGEMFFGERIEKFAKRINDFYLEQSYNNAVERSKKKDTLKEDEKKRDEELIDAVSKAGGLEFYCEQEWPRTKGWGKQSSRYVAEHAIFKFRALDIVPLTDNSATLEKRIEEHKIVLSRWEHARFCIERFLDGWIYGPTNNKELLENSTLIPFDRLLEGEKNKDAAITSQHVRLLEIWQQGYDK